MKITENFDRWMFDYKEGNLTGAEEQAFENFLIQHPEFEVDADAWDQAFVSNENIAYPNAKALEKDRKFAGWYMWSAAAVLLLLLGSTAIYFTSTNSLDLSNADLSKGSSTLLNGDGYYNAISNSNVDYNSNSGNVALTNLLSGLGLSDRTFTNPNNNQSNNSNGNNGLNNANNSINSNQPTNNNFVELNPAINNVTDLTQNSKYVGSGSGNDLISVESDKLNGNKNIAIYKGNPESKNLGFDVTKKSSNKYNASPLTLKKLYNKVERAFNAPINPVSTRSVGLTNLRDPELLLPQSSLLAFNPAFAGGMVNARFDVNYRNQWTGALMNSQELNISYDKYFKGVRGGVGVLVNAQDYAYGRFGDYNVSLIYSPKIVLGKNVMIEPSVKLTMGTIYANGDKLSANSVFEMDRGRTLNTIDDNQMSGISQLWYKDYGVGVLINTKWGYAGFSADNLSQHYENVYGNDLSSPSKSPIKMSAVVGTDYVSNNKTMTFSPFVAYQQFGDKPEIWGGMNYKLQKFIIGGSVSSNKEFTASIGMKFEKFKLVYRYDVTESVLMGDRIGSHNIGIRFNANRKNIQ